MTDERFTAALDILAASPAILTAIASASIAPSILQRPTDGDWSPRDVVVHLVASEDRGSMSRIFRVVTEEQPTLEAYDENAELLRPDLQGMDFEALAAEFARRRAPHMARLRTLDDTALARIGLHAEVGPVTARQFIWHAAYHDSLHLRQIFSMLTGLFETERGAMRVF